MVVLMTLTESDGSTSQRRSELKVKDQSVESRPVRRRTATDRRHQIRSALVRELKKNFILKQSEGQGMVDETGCHGNKNSNQYYGDGQYHPALPQLRIPSLLAASISPSPASVISTVLTHLRLSKTSLLVDLGCGDGRWMISAALQYKCRCVGCEIDYSQLRKARSHILCKGLDHNIKLYEKDLFEFAKGSLDVINADAIVLYLSQSAVSRLSDILWDRLCLQRQPLLSYKALDRDTGRHRSSKCSIVSVGFAMTLWTPADQFVVDGRNVYHYIV